MAENEKVKKEIRDLSSDHSLGQVTNRDNQTMEELKIPDKDKLFLFFSFDLVNSSKYKTYNYNNWFIVLDAITKQLKKKVREKISGSEFWRSIGDELVFNIHIVKNLELRDAVDKIYDILIDVHKGIKDGSLFKAYNDDIIAVDKGNDDILSDDEIESIIKLNLLSIKATSWIAPLNKFKKRYGYNVMGSYHQQQEMPYLEFQGNDIDTGFRVASLSRERRLSLTFDLAYILSEESITASKLNILTYRKLKGIWNDRLYPVIWYYKGKLEDSFFYDEYDNDDIARDYIDSISKEEQIDKDSRIFEKLLEIKNDMNLSNKINHIKSLLEGNIEKVNSIKDEVDRIMQMHCVAVCVRENRDKVEILMFRRSKDGVYKEKLDFGCINMEFDKSFRDILEKKYKSEYGVTIEVEEPFSMYDFQSEKNKESKTPGIRFKAEIKEVKEDIIIENYRYSEIEYIDIEKYMEYSDQFMFKDEYINVFEKIKKMKEMENK